MKVDQARIYLVDRVIQPALDHPQASDRLKNVVKDTERWLAKFKRVGDLIAYMERFRNSDSKTSTYRELKGLDLSTFEDVWADFIGKFGAWANERTRLDDFVIGQEYDSFEIHICAGRYDTRAGGIMPIGEVGAHKAVFIKATLSGGKYPNQWLARGHRLKYYLKSRGEKFDENFVENRAIATFPDVPIYAFVRPSSEVPFVLEGVFLSEKVVSELDGSKWFDLVRQERRPGSDAHDLDQIPISEERLLENEREGVEEALSRSREEREKRISDAQKKPRKCNVVSQRFIRNADVIASVLERAGANCEGCGDEAPFLRNKNATPYLEVHHKIHLANGGEDTVENAIALCPNCHRREHYGPSNWST